MTVTTVETDDTPPAPTVVVAPVIVNDDGGSTDDTPPGDIHCQHCVEHAVAIAALETRVDEAEQAATVATVIAEDALDQLPTEPIVVEEPETDNEPSRVHGFFASKSELMDRMH